MYIKSTRIVEYYKVTQLGSLRAMNKQKKDPSLPFECPFNNIGETFRTRFQLVDPVCRFLRAPSKFSRSLAFSRRFQFNVEATSRVASFRAFKRKTRSLTHPSLCKGENRTESVRSLYIGASV